MKNKISACIVIANEEKLIKECLDSIKNVVDEIIVVHDGECKDRSLEICSNYTEKIYVNKLIGNAEPHRPFSYEKAKGEWILQIDADERLSLDLQKNIRKLSEDKNIAAYELLWPRPGTSGGNKKIDNYKRCFFKKDRISFLGIPHYIVDVRGKIRKVNFVLEHKPVQEKINWLLFKNKWLKVTKFQASFYFKDFRKINKFNYPNKEWPKKIKFKVNFSIFLLPIDFFKTLLKELIKINFIGNFYEYKIAIMKALNKIMLDWYIFIYKFKNNEKNKT